MIHADDFAVWLCLSDPATEVIEVLCIEGPKEQMANKKSLSLRSQPTLLHYPVPVLYPQHIISSS